MTVDVASWKGILVPLDGSGEALRSVPIGAGVAARIGLPFSLITVVNDAAAVPSGEDVLSAVADSITAERRVLVDDSPAKRVVDEFHALPAVGALTTHRRSDVARLILGGVVSRVLSRSPTPLLVTPEHA